MSQAVDEIVTDAVDWAMQAPLRAPVRESGGNSSQEAQQEERKEACLLTNKTKTSLWALILLLPHLFLPSSAEAVWHLGKVASVVLLGNFPEHQRSSQASMLVSTYETPAENSLLAKTGDMTTFMKCLLSRCHSPSVPDGKELVSQMFTNSDYWNEYTDGDQVRSDLTAKPLHLDGPLRVKAYSRYGYDYLREIILRRADFQEHTIAEKDFKNLYPSDFEYLNLLLLQGHLGHLPSYEFKHDYTIIESPRAVVFPVDNNDRKIMRFNEIYKFNDGTLTRILEALDYRVKEFKVKRLNPGMNTRFWTEKDVIRSKEFIVAIEMRLNTRRIYRNLECFVGGRVRDIDYRLLL
ncbi:hypothetical protein Tco_0330851 [Tanacetum coccineum]